jgi:hypothetical protein
MMAWLEELLEPQRTRRTQRKLQTTEKYKDLNSGSSHELLDCLRLLAPHTA